MKSKKQREGRESKKKNIKRTTTEGENKAPKALTANRQAPYQTERKQS